MSESFCDFADDKGRCCNSIPEYSVDNQENKMNVCERHFWYLYDPDSGDDYCRLSNP
tara:strand:+ start:139 stop:309 length:171 start_codon:yes stop_codon:yes gene_type:complete